MLFEQANIRRGYEHVKQQAPKTCDSNDYALDIEF